MPYERTRIYDADFAALRHWAEGQGVSLVEAGGRAICVAVASNRDAVASVVQGRREQPAASEAMSVYAADFRTLSDWAAKLGVNMPEAFGRAIDLAVRAPREELAKAVRRRGVRRAEAEAAMVAGTA